MLLDVAADGSDQRGLRVAVHRFGAAAETGAIAGLFGFECVLEKTYVLAARAFSGARRTTEDSGAGDGEDEGSVERAVAGEDGLPAAGGYVVLLWSSLHC